MDVAEVRQRILPLIEKKIAGRGGTGMRRPVFHEAGATREGGFRR
jgi:hypothetical protein